MNATFVIGVLTKILDSSSGFRALNLMDTEDRSGLREILALSGSYRDFLLFKIYVFFDQHMSFFFTDSGDIKFGLV